MGVFCKDLAPQAILELRAVFSEQLEWERDFKVATRGGLERVGLPSRALCIPHRAV